MSRLESFLAPQPPPVGIEIASGHVTVVRASPGGLPVSIAAAAVEPLPPGALSPALTAPTIRARAAGVQAVRRALDRTGARRRRAVLVVPDTVARVSLLRFEKVPARQADLLELIRWQVRKTVPFRVEDAQLTFAPAGRSGDGGREWAVLLARQDIVAEYESVCQEAGAQVGVVDLATLNAVVAAGAAPEGDWLIVNAAAEYLSVAILRGGDLLFFRHRGSDGEESLADVVHQTAMYYEDRLQGRGFSRVLLGGVAQAAGGVVQGSAPADGVRHQLEARLRVRVETVDPRPAVVLTDRIGMGGAPLDALAPAVGLLLRERMA